MMTYRCLNDPEWTMLFVGDRTRHLTGYPPEDFISGRVSYASIIHPFDREMVWCLIQSAIAQHRPFQMEYRIITADGKEKWVWEQGWPNRAQQNGKTVIDGQIIDITERKLMELKIMRPNKYKLITGFRPGSFMIVIIP